MLIMNYHSDAFVYRFVERRKEVRQFAVFVGPCDVVGQPSGLVQDGHGVFGIGQVGQLGAELLEAELGSKVNQRRQCAAADVFCNCVT
jgi:hypothetical protein